MRRHAKAVIAATAALLLTLALSATLATAVAPVVTIEDASNVSYTTADVKGTVNPEGQSTTWRFQYIRDAQFQENLANSLPGFEGASTGDEGSTEVEGTLERQLIFLSPDTTYHLRLVAENVDGQSEAVATNTFTTKAVGPPTVTIDPVTIFTGTTAKFTGTIDPEAPEEGPGEVPGAFDVEWVFECTPECPGLKRKTIFADSDPHEVEVDAENLDPNTKHEVRLLVRNSAGEVSAGPESFKTLAVAPQVQALYAGYVEETGATLAANVNPRNSQASYQFEWGTDENYGNLAPAIPQVLGTVDNSFHIVTAPIGGLQPDSTYHFRVIATNTETSEVTEGEDHAFTTLAPPSADGPCPNDEVRTGASADLPECRAHEMVTPLDKNGSGVEIDGYLRASLVGDAITYNSRGNLPGARSSGLFNQLFSERGSDGWRSHGINPPFDPTRRFNPNAETGAFEGFAEDLSVGVAPLGQADVLGGPNHTLWRAERPFVSFLPISRPQSPLSDDGLPHDFAGASDDFSRIFFESNRGLTPEAPSHDGVRNGYLYEWAEGELSLVNSFPEGEDLAPTAALGLGSTSPFTGTYPGDHAVSADGSRVYFAVDMDSFDRRLYYRYAPNPHDPVAIEQVNASERTDCAEDPTCGGDGEPNPVPVDPGQGGALFQAANADGTRAFFISRAKLSDDATSASDLYLWDAEASPGHRLTNITTQDPRGGDVKGVAGINDAGTRIYYVAVGKLTPEAKRGIPNLYMWDEGLGVRFLATLAGEDDGGIWSMNRVLISSEGDDGSGSYRQAQVTSDGESLLFRSSAQLTSYNTNGHYQVYLYGADGDELICVSCNPRSDHSNADAWLKRRTAGTFVPLWQSRNLSADGKRVFFDSAEALVPEDSNGRIDVYEWVDGRVHLISSGQNVEDSAFLDASASGDDVFFATGARLKGGDIDNLRDIYDARVGGGFPEPSPPPVCEGDSCQPAPIEPNDPTPASAGFSGPPNPKPRGAKPRRCAKSKRAVRRQGKTRCMKRANKNQRKNRAKNERRASR